MKLLQIVLPTSLALVIAHTGPQEDGGQGHTHPWHRKEARRYYTPLDEGYELEMRIERVREEPRPEAVAMSPNGAYWFCEWKSGPRDPRIDVFNERDYFVRIELPPCRFANLQARWINEKLIYLESWIGRVVGYYAIFDVEAEEFVRREMVWIAFQQEQAKRDDWSGPPSRGKSGNRVR